MINRVVLTADEINCVVYAYLQEAGFTHSAFSLRQESHIGQSPLFKTQIPRGELVDLLTKALRYIEVETHAHDLDLAQGCTGRLTLMRPHVCSLLPQPAEDELEDTRMEEPISQEIKIPVPPKLPEPIKPPQPTPLAIVETNKEPWLQASAPTQQSAKKTMLQQPKVEDDKYLPPEAVVFLTGHQSEVFVCGFNPVHKNILASGSKDAVVRIWDVPDISGPTPRRVTNAPIPITSFSKTDSGDLTSLHWNEEGSLLAIGSYDSIVRICDPVGNIVYEHEKHRGPIFTVRFSKSGRWLASASLDNTICICDVKEKKVHRQYSSHSDCCLDVDWISDILFASCSADHTVNIHRVDDSKIVKTMRGHSNEINQIKSNAAGTRLASCSDDMTTRIWSLDNISSTGDGVPGFGGSSQSVIVLKGHVHSVSTVGWCPRAANNHELVVTASFDGSSRIWDTVTGDCLKVFADHKRPVYALSMSPKGDMFATGGGDGWLYVYDVASQEKRWSWYASNEKPGIFEITWQEGIKTGGRFALALEKRNVAIITLPGTTVES